MAKKQTRRSISVSRSTYERLKAFCEANNISMSQLVETRVNDFLGENGVVQAPSQPQPSTPRPAVAPPVPARALSVLSSVAPAAPRPFAEPPRVSAPPAITPMTSSAARSIVEPPPPIIKPKQQESAPKPAEKRPDQIFTF